MDSYKRDRVLKENSKVGGIDWDKWRIRLLTNEIDIYSLIALSLNRTPKRVFKLLSLKDVIEDSGKSIGEKIRTFTDVIKKSDKKNFWQNIPQVYGVTLSLPHMEVESAIESIEERLRIIKPHLEKLDTKPVEINGIRTYKCNIASFVALLVYLNLPHPKELDECAIEYAGSSKSFREVVEGINNPKPHAKEIQKPNKIPTEEKRKSKLITWLDKQPDTFDPFNHELTKSEIWQKAKIDNPKSESTMNRFFSETAKELISFKSGRRSKPIQTYSKAITIDKNNPAIFPLK